MGRGGAGVKRPIVSGAAVPRPPSGRRRFGSCGGPAGIDGGARSGPCLPASRRCEGWSAGPARLLLRLPRHVAPLFHRRAAGRVATRPVVSSVIAGAAAAAVTGAVPVPVPVIVVAVVVLIVTAAMRPLPVAAPVAVGVDAIGAARVGHVARRRIGPRAVGRVITRVARPVVVADARVVIAAGPVEAAAVMAAAPVVVGRGMRRAARRFERRQGKRILIDAAGQGRPG